MLTFFLLAQVALPASFSQIPRPGMGPDGAVGIAKVCGVTTLPTIGALFERDRLLGDSLIWHQERPESRTDLGCIRALLSTTNAFGREGYGMTEGTPWSRGAVTTLLDALTHRPDDSRAADALALVALQARRPKDIQKIAKALAEAVRLGVRSMPALRGCSSLAYRIADTTQLMQCVQVALATGVDSSWHQMLLARVRYDAADSIEGAKHFFAAVATAHDSLERAEISWQLQWFLSPDEMAEWNTKADSNPAKQVQDWLTKRDIRDGRPPGSRLAAHFSRLKYCEDNFWLDIARVVEGAFLTGASSGETVGSKFRDYDRWQIDFDDRGVVWMRFGEPADIRVAGTDSDAAAGETHAWIYHLDGQQFFLTFTYDMYSGTVSPTRLVAGLTGEWLCDLEWDRCPDRQLKGVIFGADSVRMDLKQRDRATIAYATQHDDNTVRAKKNIAVAAQLYRLWDPKTELPFALVGYSLLLQQMEKKDSGLKRVAVDLTVEQWDRGIDYVTDTTMRRMLNLPNKPGKYALFEGFLAVPSTLSTSVWSLAAKQGDRAWGRDMQDNKAPILPGPFKISDLVLGAESQKLTWRKGSESAALAPEGQLDRTKDISLFFQIMTRSAHPDVTATIAIYRTDEPKPSPDPKIKLSFPEHIPAGLASFTRHLDVSRLAKGLYRLEVVIETSQGELLGKQSTEMRLR